MFHIISGYSDILQMPIFLIGQRNESFAVYISVTDTYSNFGLAIND